MYVVTVLPVCLKMILNYCNHDYKYNPIFYNQIPCKDLKYLNIKHMPHYFK